MSFVTVDIPTTTSFLNVDTQSNSKVLYLPTASTIQGRFLTLKDFYGTANINNFTISTTGLDRIDIYNSSILISTSFQSISLLSYEKNGWSILTNQGSTLPSSITDTFYDTAIFNADSSIYSVNVSSSAKIIQLPAISTIPGQMIVIKDAEGFSGSNNSSILVSTSGIDYFEYSTTSTFILSQSFGSWTFMNDGDKSWFLVERYLNNANVKN